jgi:hypothetical protein
VALVSTFFADSFHTNDHLARRRQARSIKQTPELRPLPRAGHGFSSKAPGMYQSGHMMSEKDKDVLNFRFEYLTIVGILRIRKISSFITQHCQKG